MLTITSGVAALLGVVIGSTLMMAFLYWKDMEEPVKYAAIAIVAAGVLALGGLGVYASTTQSDSGFGFCGLEGGPSYEATSQEDCNRWLEENGGRVIPTP